MSIIIVPLDGYFDINQNEKVLQIFSFSTASFPLFRLLPPLQQQQIELPRKLLGRAKHYCIIATKCGPPAAPNKNSQIQSVYLYRSAYFVLVGVSVRSLYPI